LAHFSDLLPIIIFNQIWKQFSANFVSNLVPKSDQNSLKIDSKTMLKSVQNVLSFFVQFSSIFHLSRHPKSSKQAVLLLKNTLSQLSLRSPAPSISSSILAPILDQISFHFRVPAALKKHLKIM